jgi:hypothetical protein
MESDWKMTCRERRRARRARIWRLVAAIVSGLSVPTLTFCNPLSGPVLDAAQDYHDVMATNSDQILVDNILRASYEAPLNLTDLATITGVLSASGTLSASFPFPHGSSNPISLSPSITASSTPTFTMVPLNTNGFTVGIIQPMAPQTLVQLWNSDYGLDFHTFLLRLFIKFVNLEPDPTKTLGNRSCVNLPDADTQSDCLTWFLQLKPHSVTVLEPLGPTFGLDKVTPVKNLVGITNGDYRVGNVTSGEFQLYEVYTGQVVLCTSNAAIARSKKLIQTSRALQRQVRARRPPPPPSEVQRLLELPNSELQLFATTQALRGNKPPSGNAGPSSASSTSGQGTGAPSSGSHGAQTQTTVNTVLQQNRISAIFNDVDEACRQDQVVLPRTTEEDFATATADFAHVDMRSTAELITYLGAVVDYQRHSPNSEILAITKDTFALAENPPVDTFIKVPYRGKIYGVTGKYSMRALQILSELLNEAKVSSDIQATSPALFLPIP